MTLEEQRDYWEERYKLEEKKNKELINHFEELINEMNKNGSMYWARRLRELL